MFPRAARAGANFLPRAARAAQRVQSEVTSPGYSFKPTAASAPNARAALTLATSRSRLTAGRSRRAARACPPPHAKEG
jgi:hypothetical protein